jgi:hypothetical protein
MINFIFDKTDKGREEISTRKYKLASRLRTLLLIIDGKKSTAELMQNVGGLGLDEQSLVDLVEGDFIENIADLPTVVIENAPSQTTIPVFVPAPVSVSVCNVEQNDVAAPEPAAPSASQEGKLIGSEQILALHNFFNETIKSTVGLRGFTLQLKAERAMTMHEFRELRQLYLEAVLKAKGNEMARSLAIRLDQLLAEAEQSSQ